MANLTTGLLSGQSAVRRIEVGEVTLTYASDGAMGLAPEVFFPGTPAAHWREHAAELDPAGRVPLSCGGLLVRRRGHAATLLIDTGMGPVRRDSGGVTANTGALPEVLAALDAAPDRIGTVALTHLHSDHTGWLFHPDGRPVFPAAELLLSDAEWAPHADGAALLPGREPLRAKHTLVSDGDEVWPGVRALVTQGHSAGHTTYVIDTGDGGRVLAFGDVVHQPAQFAHPDWPSLPDLDATGVLAARQRIAAELTRPGTIGFGGHFGDQVFGRLDADHRWLPEPSQRIAPPPRQL